MQFYNIKWKVGNTLYSALNHYFFGSYYNNTISDKIIWHICERNVA